MLASRRINELNLKEKALQEINLSWRKEALAKKRKFAVEASIFGYSWCDLGN